MYSNESKEKFLNVWFFKMLDCDIKLNSLYDKNLNDITELYDTKKISFCEYNNLIDNHNELIFFVLNTISKCPFIKFDSEFLAFIENFSKETTNKKNIFNEVNE